MGTDTGLVVGPGDHGEAHPLVEPGGSYACVAPHQVRELDQVWTQALKEFTKLARRDVPPEQPGKAGKRNKAP